jgi:hypothetical protein
VKKIVALYKAYRGGEWFRASLEAVRPHVDAIAVVFSGVPWHPALGKIPGNCNDPLRDFRAAHPGMDVLSAEIDVREQENQQLFGLGMVEHNFGSHCAVLVPDTDEIWDDADLTILCEAIRTQPAAYYVTELWDYVKSPFWRIDNQTGPYVAALGSPNPPVPLQGRFGGWQPHPHVKLDLRFHHFTYVREDPQEIPLKMLNTATQDGAYRADWMEVVWPRLPAGENLHPTPRFEWAWPKVDVVDRSQLPAVLERVPETKALLDRYDEYDHNAH